MARPRDLVAVAVGAYEQAWLVHGLRMALCDVLCAMARADAERALDGFAARPVPEALKLAWGTVHPIMERLMRGHGYLTDTVAVIRTIAARNVREVADAVNEGAEATPAL
ncbi:hypothetical protein SMC26_39610 [Actinomadura fulvescens]